MQVSRIGARIWPPPMPTLLRAPRTTLIFPPFLIAMAPPEHLPLPSLARTSEQNLATRTHTLAHTHTRAHTHMHTHTHTFSLSLSLSLSLSGRAWAWWAARVHGAPSSPLRLRQHVRLQQLRLRRTAVLLQPRRPWWHASLPVVIVVVIVHWNPHVNRFALCFKWWASKSRDEVLGSVCVCVRKSVSSCFLVATI